MPRPFDVAGFGAVAIDTIIRTEGVLGDGKGRVRERREAHGGNVATGLAAVASLGGRAAFLGALSEDPDSRKAADALKDAGVDISLAAHVAGARPILSTIVVDAHGDRFIAFDDADFRRAAPVFTDAALLSASVLLVDGFASAHLSAVRRAQESGALIVGDIERSFGTAGEELIALCDHINVPRSFAVAHTGCASIEDAADAMWNETRRSVVVTDGASGGVLIHRDDRTPRPLPTFDVQVVDTTGAGDVFNGAFALSIARGEGPADAAQFAAAAAAISVTGLGGRGALLSEAACRALLSSVSPPTDTSHPGPPDGGSWPQR
ncbi:MAG: PfkB family carbohydrate kinase [Pseudomonadota bacterium]